MIDLRRAADLHTVMAEIEKEKKMNDWEVDREFYCPDCGLRRGICDCGQLAQDQWEEDEAEEFEPEA